MHLRQAKTGGARRGNRRRQRSHGDVSWHILDLERLDILKYLECMKQRSVGCEVRLQRVSKVVCAQTRGHIS